MTYCNYCKKPLLVAEEAEKWCEGCGKPTSPAQSNVTPVVAPKAKRAA
jgi:predicted amidophosphoribosyltransferase